MLPQEKWELTGVYLNETGGQLLSTNYSNPGYAAEGEFVGNILDYMDKPESITGKCGNRFYITEN